MSGLAGFFMRTGAPAALPIAHTMAEAAPLRARSGTWSVRDGPFAGVSQRSMATFEDAAEREPVVDRGARLALLFDGRLDNREELADALGLCAGDRSSCPDARLALACWKKWRDETPLRVLGDFAFAVWNGNEQTLTCARDPMGVRPFFYWLSDRAFVFGSEARQVLAHPIVPRAPDEVMVGRLLSAALPRVSDRTLYRGVTRLPHGHVLTIARDRVSRRRYWQIDLARELRLANDAEYADAFREVFDRAVAARMRSSEPVGAYLSGGLDSSSVVAAARVVPGGRKASLTACTLIFPGEPAADEREYSQAVLARTGITGVQIVPRAADIAAVRRQIAARGELPDFPNDHAGDAVRRAMSLRGIRVALTGTGGDIGLSGSHFHYADLLRRVRLVRFLRRYADVARQPAMSWTSADLLPCAVWPLLPATLRRALRPLARRIRRQAAPPWIAAPLAVRTGLGGAAPLREIPSGQMARSDVHDGYDNGWLHMVLDMYQRGSLEWGIEDRHPFLDRRVIEFSVALPDEQRWQQGMTRYILRRSFSDRLPPVVRDRPDQGKGDFSHLYLQALESLGGAAFFCDAMESAGNEWVVASEARRLYDRMMEQRAAGDAAYGDSAFRLWNIAAVELWHQEMFGLRAGRSAWRIETGGRSGSAAEPNGSRTAALC